MTIIRFAAALLALATPVVPAACAAQMRQDKPTPTEIAPAASEIIAQLAARGQAFLDKNRTAEGVVVTPSGMQYRVVRSGAADGRSPTRYDQVTFHYAGFMVSGEQFDSSYDRGQPLTGEPADFVPGFAEALTMMKPGDVWMIWLPPELGYGANQAGAIPPNSVLAFRLELLDFLPNAG